jgi:hypothetical protein
MERSGMLKESDQTIQQTTVILPYFDSEVPVLCLLDGTRYLPVVALCKMLGLRANTHIPRWRRLVLWSNAQKLPWRAPTGRTHIVWCLHLGALPFLCACFNWSLVTPLRQAQLREATDAWLKAMEQAQQEMLTGYRQMRRLLFEFLAAYANAESMLSRAALLLAPRLDSSDARIQLEQRISYGHTLIQQATDHARETLHAQATIPIVDVVELSKYGEVMGTCSLPLFPIVPRGERAQFFEYLNLLSNWHREFAAFLKSVSAL